MCVIPEQPLHYPMHRRLLLQASLAGLFSGLKMLQVQASEALSYTESVVYQQDLPAVHLEDWIVRAVELTFPPGGPPSTAHRHPGFVIGYVLEGQICFQIDGEPATILAAGQFFYEAPNKIHLAAHNASDTELARAIALVFGEQNSELTLPV